jgi:hypothetical protein
MPAARRAQGANETVVARPAGKQITRQAVLT